jgi:hypothetical protein
MKQISDKTRELLSIAAKKNGLGGIVLVDKICTQCELEYKGISNQLLCNQCKAEGGYSKKCNHCGNGYKSKGNGGKYCSDCSKTKAYQIGKRRDAWIGEKIADAKRKFFKTEYGKEVAKNVGKANSINLKNYFKTDAGKAQIHRSSILQSRIMIDKIKSGEFTPNITNSFTKWDAKILLEDGTYKKFRSSWEACFWYSNRNLKYEYMRISYIDQNGLDRTYIADFINESGDILYEIKPKSYFPPQKNKMDSIISYCNSNGIKFMWINEYNIMNYIDIDIFEGENYKQLEKLFKGINYVAKN